MTNYLTIQMQRWCEEEVIKIKLNYIKWSLFNFLNTSDLNLITCPPFHFNSSLMHSSTFSSEEFIVSAFPRASHTYAYLDYQTYLIAQYSLVLNYILSHSLWLVFLKQQSSKRRSSATQHPIDRRRVYVKRLFPFGEEEEICKSFTILMPTI